jgi:hypothetical protein
MAAAIYLLNRPLGHENARARKQSVAAQQLSSSASRKVLFAPQRDLNTTGDVRDSPDGSGKRAAGAAEAAAVAAEQAAKAASASEAYPN